MPVDDVSTALPLFDDNPAEEDLLGFDTVADVVTRVVTAGGLDPVTVGIHSAWGGGKSTALNLINARLATVGHVVVVRIDPWEFENTEDLRGTLIAQVLNELQDRIEQDDDEPTIREKALTKLNDLRRRIAWGRVAQVLVTSAVTLSPDIPKLVEALTPKPREDTDGGGDGPQGMAGFRDQFAALMKEVSGITKVVVLVDDLDRCLPPTIMATLEAIKLFLSVKKMAFVIAADEDLIRAGCNERRRAGTAPYVVAAEDGVSGPLAAHLVLAASIAKGLSADVWRSPRAIKRFLNAFAVRNHLAYAAGAGLTPDVLLKLYLLELRYLPEFQLLAQQSTGERATLVAAWEQWARGDAPQPPDGIAESTRLWAATEPFLEGRGSEIERYLSVAATLHSDVRFGGAINAKHTVWRHVMKWVTRVRPTTDRIACPWLIRRFIDPDAQILFVPADQVLDVAAREGGYSFDAKDATYTHRRTPDGELCTFEVLIAEHHLGDDPALARLARIVHATDVSGQLDTDPLGPGLLAIGQGGLHVEDDDQRLLARGMFVYDALYAWCQHHDQAQAA